MKKVCEKLCGQLREEARLTIMAGLAGLPAGDRADPVDAPRADDGLDRRQALAIRFATDGRYFKAWQPGRCVSVRAIARARLFSTSARADAAREIARLRRKGIAASVVEV